ncbi:cyclin-I [Aplysia californica]|uniref:Cyclin-I n=1 Tax=Aplysia californica TaxID=6500 RepID=A0ABM0K893_APLCA|nr:cyclin-I [Aplysia californica]
MCLKPKDSTMVLADKIMGELQQVMNKEASFTTGGNLKELNNFINALQAPEEYDRYTDIRVACVHYIRCPHVFFKTKSDTFAIAVQILDIILWKFKVTQRFMSIIGAACYIIAAKMVEEDEVIPSPHDLAQLPGHEWTRHDLCRMELYILDKLSWAPPRITYLSYLPVLAQLFDLNQNAVLSPPIVVLAERCLKSKSTVLMPPCSLALALVLHLTGSPHDSLTEEKQFQVMKFCKIEEPTLKRCVEKLAVLSSSAYPPLPSESFRTGVTFPLKIFNKPSEMGSPELATIHE